MNMNELNREHQDSQIRKALGLTGTASFAEVVHTIRQHRMAATKLNFADTYDIFDCENELGVSMIEFIDDAMEKHGEFEEYTR